ncbi:MAG: hypothetical protein KDD63_08150, partial [Bacteroidetes bacterium]|nr:hypothetical protein [Bacteroidota bacterium]
MPIFPRIKIRVNSENILASVESIIICITRCPNPQGFILPKIPQYCASVSTRRKGVNNENILMLEKRLFYIWRCPFFPGLKS